jgi:hypothetical protein
MKFELDKHGLGWRASLYNHFIWRSLTWDFRENYSIFNSGGVYQFGVWKGFSMQVLGKIFGDLKMTDLKYYAFDVFTGMPVEAVEPEQQVDTPGWYNILEYYGVKDLNHAVSLLENDIRYNMYPGAKIKFTLGLVENTLTDELAKALPIASYVDMDMDIYSPTRHALDFLFKHKKIVKGTIIGYDDWIQKDDCVTFECGESRAHKEIFDKYNVKAVQLLETINRGQTAFIVTDIGNE